MSEQPASGKPNQGSGSGLQADAIVERVAPSGGEPNPVVVLTGLVGQGNTDGVWRLYLSQRFDEYVEFEAADVVHSQAVNEAMPLDGTRVWVRTSAKLQYTQVSSRQVQADFLSGGITSGHLPRAGGPSFGGGEDGGTGYACTRNYVCSINPHIPACQQRTEYCGSLDCPATGPFCSTGAFVC